MSAGEEATSIEKVGADLPHCRWNQGRPLWPIAVFEGGPQDGGEGHRKIGSRKEEMQKLRDNSLLVISLEDYGLHYINPMLTEESYAL